MSKKLKVLAIAYRCNPYQGSEAGVGWGWVNCIAKYHELSVITAEFERKDIENAVAVAADAPRSIKFYFLPRTCWLTLEKIWRPAYLATYKLWQRSAYELALELHREFEFDLVHLITYVGFRVPGHFWEMNIPFVWGPIGGLENTLWRFFPVMGLKGAAYYTCRNAINSIQKRFLRMPKKAFREASAIIAATESIKKEIWRFYRQDSEVICEIGVLATNKSADYRRSKGGILKLSWSGRHFAGKALPLLLQALIKLSPEVKWQLDILGSGPCTKKWRHLAKKLGIDEHCRWHGHLNRAQAISIVRESHIFVITSLKDLTSTVLLEALSQGVPVICPDHCGFSDVITENCGIKLALKSPAQLIEDLAVAIARLAIDETERYRLSKGALQRITCFFWQKKAEKINEIYRRISKT